MMHVRAEKPGSMGDQERAQFNQAFLYEGIQGILVVVADDADANAILIIGGLLRTGAGMRSMVLLFPAPDGLDPTALGIGLAIAPKQRNDTRFLPIRDRERA